MNKALSFMRIEDVQALGLLKKNDRQILAQQVKDLRKAMNKTQEQFAKEVGQSRRTIVRWEDTGIPTKFNGLVFEHIKTLLKKYNLDS